MLQCQNAFTSTFYAGLSVLLSWVCCAAPVIMKDTACRVPGGGGGAGGLHGRDNPHGRNRNIHVVSTFLDNARSV